MAENINIDFMPNRKTSDMQRVTTVEDYLKMLTDRTKFCFTSIYDDFADMGKRIEYLENFSLAMPSSVDLTVENAVILQEAESQQVIHNFTKTHYVKGNNVGYGGVGNSFILGGYLVTTEYMKGDADYLYSEISFPKGTRINSSGVHGDTYDNLKFYPVIKGSSESQMWYVDGFSSDGEQITETGTHHYAPNGCGFGYGLKLASSINPPDETFAYGSADVQMYTSYETATNYWISYWFRLPFQSEAEYNAAVGLTNTPIELIKLQDFQYLVPESKLIVDKALSPDSDNVIANSAVAKAIGEKADKETVETLSLKVDSKADIAEVEALTEIVNGKAEGSDLTAHVDNRDNPHEVTKEQIGLSKVENKNSADILSELEVGGRNYVRNSAFMVDTTGWTLDVCSSRDTTRTLNGHPSLKVELTGQTSSPYDGAVTYNMPYLRSLNVNKGEIWTISGWYYVEDISTVDLGIGLSFRGRNSSNVLTTIGELRMNPADIKVGSWTKMSATITANADYTGCLFQIWIRQNGTAWFTDLKVERGSKATDWTPAPEDAEIRITSLEERVSALEAAILSLGGET